MPKRKYSNSFNINVCISPGKTARERWKLFKNVSRIGLQRTSNEDENLSVVRMNTAVFSKISSYFMNTYRINIFLFYL